MDKILRWLRWVTIKPKITEIAGDSYLILTHINWSSPKFVNSITKQLNLTQEIFQSIFHSTFSSWWVVVSLFWGLKMPLRHPLGVLIGGIRRNGTANVGLDHLFLRETLDIQIYLDDHAS